MFMKNEFTFEKSILLIYKLCFAIKFRKYVAQSWGKVNYDNSADGYII